MKLYSKVNTVRGSVRLDGGTYRLQISYVYYKLESKVTSNFDVTSKKLGRFEKKKFYDYFKFFSSRRPAKIDVKVYYS